MQHSAERICGYSALSEQSLEKDREAGPLTTVSHEFDAIKQRVDEGFDIPRHDLNFSSFTGPCFSTCLP